MFSCKYCDNNEVQEIMTKEEDVNVLIKWISVTDEKTTRFHELVETRKARFDESYQKNVPAKKNIEEWKEAV